MSRIRIPNYVSYYRKKAGLSQSQLASICGCSKNTISSIERGIFDPSLSLAYLISDAVHRDLYELFNFRPLLSYV